MPARTIDHSAVPTTTKPRYCRVVVAAADDVEHHDEDQRRRERLGHRVDEEQERVGPVRLHLPAEADRRSGTPRHVSPDPRASARDRVEAAPLGRLEAGAVDGRRSVRRPRSLPSHRQAAFAARHPLERRSIQRAASEEHDGHRHEDQRLDLGRRRADRERRDPTKASWRIASRPTASGIVARASAPIKPEARDREVEPATRSTPARSKQLGQLERLAAPHQEQAGQIIPSPYRAARVSRKTATSRNHCSTSNVTP